MAVNMAATMNALAGGAVIIALIESILFMWFLKKTHAWQEFMAHFRGKTICLFFNDNKTVEWKAVKPEAGIINDDIYGSFLINERGVYTDRKTRHVIAPFSTSIAVGAPVKLVKMSDDLSKILRDEKDMHALRDALFRNEIDDNDEFSALKESVNFNSLKEFANCLIPHNITAKINMTIAQRLKGYGAINNQQMFFWIILTIGAVGLMAMVLWMTLKGGNAGGAASTVSSIAGSVNPSSIIAG